MLRSLALLLFIVHSALAVAAGASGGYDRKAWPHWIDADGDCQNTRAEVLIAHSEKPVVFKRGEHCSVVMGRWFDPYTGKVFTEAKRLDIDHIVPLSWAHAHGGANWSKSTKRKFANDLQNLLPVDAGANRAKGDKGPNEWMPPNFKYRCEYLGRFSAIVVRYKMNYSASEQRIVDRMSKACAK